MWYAIDAPRTFGRPTGTGPDAGATSTPQMAPRLPTQPSLPQGPAAPGPRWRLSFRAGTIYTGCVEALLIVPCLYVAASLPTPARMLVCRSAVSFLRQCPLLALLALSRAPASSRGPESRLRQLYHFLGVEPVLGVRAAWTGLWLMLLSSAGWREERLRAIIIADILHSCADVVFAIGVMCQTVCEPSPEEAPDRTQVDVRPRPKHETFVVGQSPDEEAGGSGLDDTTCVICLSSLADGDIAARLHCGHTFHEACIEQWFRAKAICPLRCTQVQAPALGQPVEEDRFSPVMDSH